MFRFYAGCEIAILTLSVAALVACSVDDRSLSPTTNMGGAGGATAAGNGAFAGNAALAGEGGSTIEPLPVCVFGETVPNGCDTLVNNPGFAHDTSGWSAEMPSISMAWSDSDAASNRASGSLFVQNSLAGTADGIGIRGAAQCLPATAGRGYGFAADILIPEGQGAGLDGGSFEAGAGVSVIFYSTEDCTGYSASNFTSEVSLSAGDWAHREGRALAPEGAQSMLVRLVTLKNFRQFTFKALFDNVLLKAE